jgi:hypothetical protein
VVLADLDLASDLAPGVAHVVAGRDGLLFIFAVGERAPWRLLATRPAGPVPPRTVNPFPPTSCGGFSTPPDSLPVGGQPTTARVECSSRETRRTATPPPADRA